MQEGQNERRGWLTLAALLIGVGVAGPDTLGPDHGAYLPQRVVLCGLVALVAVVDIELRRWSGRAASEAVSQVRVTNPKAIL